MRKEGRPENGKPGEGLPIPSVPNGNTVSVPVAVPPGRGDPVPPARFVVLSDPRGRTRAVRAAIDPDVELRFPALWEYLTCCLVEDKGRLTSTLIMSCEDGQVKLCLSDRETDQVLWKAGKTVQDALESLERSLADGTAEWRIRKEYTPKRR